MNRFVIFSVALFLIILVLGSGAFVLSMQNIVREQKSGELSQMLEIQRIKLETFTSNELTVVLKMASSPLIKRFFLTPGNEDLKKYALEEIEGYRLFFESLLIFWINDVDRIFHFTNAEPYIMNPDDPDSYWYKMTLYETERYNFNINYNPDLGMMYLWINAPVFDDNRKPIGMLGSGIELMNYIKVLYDDVPANTQFYIFNSSGEITGATDTELIKSKRHIHEKLDYENVDILRIAKDLLPGHTQSVVIPSGVLSVGTIPMLGWYTVAFTPINTSDYDSNMTALFFIVLAVMAIIIVIFNVFISGFLNSLKKTMESLEKASKAKSDFLAAMSHEIRTPMNAIIGISQIQLQNSYLPAECSTALEKIYNSGSSLLGIINDILDMSKIETGKLELNPVEYDVPSLINDTVQLNMVRIESKPVNFMLDINENVPLKLYGDELRLKQILNNLLSNAIKYTKEGYVKLSVSHSADENNINLRFVVEDTGKGIRNEDQKKLFSEYQRFDAKTNRETEGTGLGLNITKKLVEMMEGEIEVKSEYGKGSTFAVTVKQKPIKGASTVIGPILARQLCSFTYKQNRYTSKSQVVQELMPYGKVLVVDDVETNLYVAEGLLSPYKLNVQTANDGFDAIKKAESGEIYDVIFMDHMMPLMDGIETTLKLRVLGYKGVIVALTANALVGNEEMFRQNGFDGFISKPIDIRQLNAVLNRFVRDRHPEEAAQYKNMAAPAEEAEPVQAAEINHKLLNIFRQDAVKAAKTLRETASGNNIKLFTTTAHAIKSALANIGEDELSGEAFALERAAANGDIKFVFNNTESFIKKLEALINDLPLPGGFAGDNPQTEEDTAYLLRQLEVIKNACSQYDDTAAYAAIEKLKEKQWRWETAYTLEEIHDALFLHSDFEKGEEIARLFLESLPKNG